MNKSVKKLSLLICITIISNFGFTGKNVIAAGLTDTNFKSGLVPYKVKITKNTDYNIAKSAGILPAKFDLRAQGDVTSVKNQGGIGDCWAFAATGSLESNLKINENKDYDFSEINMATHHGFDFGPDAGGNNEMATAYLARWEGPVLEADDPYPNPSEPSNIIVRDNLNAIKHIQGVDYIPDRTSPIDNDDIKNELMKYGAVSTSILMSEKYLNSNNAYYCYDVTYTNHEVDIVGWDDTYSRDNFLVKPDGDGAFICKNSYSQYFGENGYFYVSYYDKGIGTDNAVITGVEPVSNYSNIYQYDPLGMTGTISPYGSSIWFANVFTAENKSTSSEALKAVSFYTTKKNANYEVYIESDYDTNGFDKINLNKQASGTIEQPGYHTIKLNSSINLLKGKKYAVAVKLTGSDIGYETPVNGYSSKATAMNGESYISGNGTYWQDVNDSYSSNSNVCLKAFTTRIIDKTSDVNKDGLIDIKDIAAEAKLYNIKSSDTLYNGSFDLNSDNIIDIFDLILVSNKLDIN